MGYGCVWRLVEGRVCSGEGLGRVWTHGCEFMDAPER